MLFSIRHRFTGKVLRTVDVGERRIEPYAPDLRGMDFTNTNLHGAELQFANLEGATLLGADLREANLQNANLRSSDMRYCCLDGADLRESDLRSVTAYPASVSKRTKFWGAKIDKGSDLEELQIEILQEVWRRK